ncbi:hypothetical protein BC939DRAFT_396346, partial [Gamsiella multidivaricata]|uniref:uncharacterized protein n=1 Tax=Gamsiella multidivaricata TaxID=101098 RepID=UPI0022210AD3
IFFVHPTAGELFFLRLLLNAVKSPKSYDDLLTVHGGRHATFKAAFMALGLLQDDRE